MDAMSFKEYDKRTFIARAASDFAARRISKRDFLRKMAWAGIGFSAFNLGLLGTGCRRGSTTGTPAEGEASEEITRWLRDVGGTFKGSKVRYTSEATPPTVALDQIKNEFTGPTG